MAASESDAYGHVLIAGADQDRRATMLTELRGLLPPATSFVEARETWEVLEHAAVSRMVVVTGDLADLSAGSLMRALDRRHPTLPVVAVGERTCPPAPRNAGIALV